MNVTLRKHSILWGFVKSSSIVWKLFRWDIIMTNISHRWFYQNHSGSVVEISFRTSTLLFHSKVYLEPSSTSAIELFWENKKRLKAVNYFRKKDTLQIFDWIPNTPQQLILLIHPAWEKTAFLMRALTRSYLYFQLLSMAKNKIPLILIYVTLIVHFYTLWKRLVFRYHQFLFRTGSQLLNINLLFPKNLTRFTSISTLICKRELFIHSFSTILYISQNKYLKLNGSAYHCFYIRYLTKNV